MRRAWAICKKELQLYFYSPIAYVAFAFYFLISGYFFSMNFLSSQVVDVRMLTGNAMVIYLFVIPLLTMRLVSDEFRQGTDELLLTSPAGIGEIIIGKYMSAFIVQVMLIIGSLLYPFIMSRYGDLDQPVLWMSTLSMLLIGITMMAVGLFASSLSSHQMVAGIAGFCLLLLLWMIDWLGETLGGSAGEWIAQFSIVGRTANFDKGIFDLADFLFFIMFTIVFVMLSIQVVERKRWR
ncbi:ABC transporter permease subunit [Paenibacillus sp. HJGM_3]|uniref:ABC transporter permease subunit n=1 Tax=Paenibacillus sp. HJGM_3 TaxID=3379816 RepID=UPI00385F891F